MSKRKTAPGSRSRFTGKVIRLRPTVREARRLDRLWEAFAPDKILRAV